MMALKKNPLKLNKLQLRTLTLAQVLARDSECSIKDARTGEVTLTRIPHVHGDHVHVSKFTVAAKDASGFSNPAVWVALARKGLVKADHLNPPILTAKGVLYDTGLGAQFLEESDH